MGGTILNSFGAGHHCKTGDPHQSPNRSWAVTGRSVGHSHSH